MGIRERFHRIVPIGGLTISVALTVFLGLGYFFGSADALPFYFGAGYCVFAAFVVWLRPRVQWMIAGGCALMVLAVAVNGGSEYITLLLTSIVLFALLAVTLAEQWWPSAALFSAILMLISFLDLRDRVFTVRLVELTSLIAIVWVGSWLMWSLSRSAGTSAARNEALFERSPIPTWELDYSDVLEQFMALRANGVRRLDDHFEVRPQDVARLGNMVRILRANPAALTQFGLPSDTERPAYLGDLDEATFQRVVREELVAVWSGVPEIQREFETRLVDGSTAWTLQRWVPTRHRRMVDPTSVILVATDLTMQKHAEFVLADQVRQKDEFIAAVSHELRTPLAVVVGLAQELSENPDNIEKGESAELVAMIANQSLDVAHIVEDLLVAARLDTGDITVIPEPMSLLPLVTAVVGDTDVEVDIAADLAAIADPYRIRQVLRNLLTNASRYGGSSVRVVAETQGRNTILEVRDDGDGVAEHLRQRIFEPYERGAAGADRRMSVGLGLTVSRQLAEMMDGTLDYRRDRGESVFRLILPRAVVSHVQDSAAHTPSAGD